MNLLRAALAAFCLLSVSQFVSAQQPAPEKQPKSPSDTATRVRIPTYLAESITREVVLPRDTGVSGEVMLEVLVDKNGRVLDVRGMSGDSRLVRGATRAVMNWVFNPYFLNGEPVQFLTELTFRFDGKRHFAKLKVVADPLTTANARVSDEDPPFVSDHQRPVKVVKPIYPTAALKAEVEGVVNLEVLVGKDGRVESAKVVTGPPLLREAAVEAVRQWVWEPFLLNSSPIRVKTRATIKFDLPKRAASPE